MTQAKSEANVFDAALLEFARLLAEAARRRAAVDSARLAELARSRA